MNILLNDDKKGTHSFRNKNAQDKTTLEKYIQTKQLNNDDQKNNLTYFKSKILKSIETIM